MKIPQPTLNEMHSKQPVHRLKKFPIKEAQIGHAQSEIARGEWYCLNPTLTKKKKKKG